MSTPLKPVQPLQHLIEHGCGRVNGIVIEKQGLLPQASASQSAMFVDADVLIVENAENMIFPIC